MKNTLGDLNNHLFAQMERLSDEDLKGEELKEELKRAAEVAKIAGRIIENGALVLRAKKVVDNELGGDPKNLPRMLEG